MLIESQGTAKRDSDDCEERTAASSGSSLLSKVGTALCVALICSVAAKVCWGQTTIASKRNHELYISLTSKAGKLVAGTSEYCALFSITKGDAPTHVEDVFVEFAQQIGKIRENPRKFPLALDNLGAYCGEVDLGKQYYQPAFYYVEVHYAVSSRKRRTCRFFLTMK
jgi:hypothetical protein